MTTYLFVILKTLISFSVMLVLTRVLGKKQISQMSYFTYITGITLGNVAASMIVDKSVTILVGVTGLILWAVLAIIVEMISLKSSRARVLLDGEPSIVIKKGVIQRKHMSKTRLNMDDLTMLLRNQNVFSITDVDYAILEPNGSLSVLKKPEKDSVTKADMQIPVEQRNFLPTELIVDGSIVKRNLKELNINEDWLKSQIQAAGLKTEEVMFAEIQSNGNLYINRKSDQVQEG